MSTILPLCDAFLDVRMTSEELGRMLAHFEEYMPRNHRTFLEEVRCSSARDFIQQLIAEDDEQAATLVDHFNAVVRRVLDFRWRHLSYIEQYILKPSGEAHARGTGGTPAFTYLNQHINDTERAMLEMPVGRILRQFSKAKMLADAGGEESSPMIRPWLDPTDVEAIKDFELDDDVSHELQLWAVTHINGLLPTSPPMDVSSLPVSWAAVVQLVQQLPTSCVPPTTFHQEAVAACARFPASCDGLDSIRLLERARSVLAYLVAGWVAANTYLDGGAIEPPQALTSLFGEVCRRVGRAPRLGIVDLTLYNWSVPELPDLPDATDAAAPSADAEPRSSRAMSDPPSPHGRRGEPDLSRGVPRPQLTTMANISPIQRFICVEEEDWFCRLHVTLAGETGEVMRSVKRCMRASSTAEQVSGLQGLEKAIEVLVRVHYAAGIGQPIGADVPKVRPALLMRRLHRFMPQVPDSGLEKSEQRAARIYCATGIDQSCLMHLLGVPRGTHALSRFRDWMESESAAELPAEHRSFLADILSRTSIREEVERAVGVKVLSVPELARLELAHNSCIDMLLRYFSRRIELVRAMLGEDSLRACYDVERANIQSARLRLLVERREMVGQQEGLDTRAKFYKRDPGERGV